MLVQDARSFLFFLSNRGSRGPVLWWEGKIQLQGLLLLPQDCPV